MTVGERLTQRPSTAFQLFYTVYLLGMHNIAWNRQEEKVEQQLKHVWSQLYQQSTFLSRVEHSFQGSSSFPGLLKWDR